MSKMVVKALDNINSENKKNLASGCFQIELNV